MRIVEKCPREAPSREVKGQEIHNHVTSRARRCINLDEYRSKLLIKPIIAGYLAGINHIGVEWSSVEN